MIENTFENDLDSTQEAKTDAFDTLNIKPELLRAVEEKGFTMMTPIQKQAIPVLLTGKDLIGQAQTGTGKTAAFGLPILQMVDPQNKNLQAVILCPTRELAMQAAEDLRDFSRYLQGVKVLPVYGGADILRQIKGLKGVQIVVGTPGRVMDHMRRHTIKLDHVSMVILDEADEMLDMGFREDMEYILGDIPGDHQTCLFSATMPEEILGLTKKFQKDPVFIKITGQELTVDSIRQYFYGVKHEYKDKALIRLLSYYKYGRCIVFCNTKSMVDELSDLLTKAGFMAEGLHGDLTQKQRDAVMGRFRSGNLHILLATDIAARGIDVDNVEAVINYDVPSENEYYVHRIGRTGRAGKEGVSHTLCSSREFRKLHQIENMIHAQMEERKIPSSDEINAMQVKAAFDRVLESLNEGHSGGLIPLIRNYCQGNNVTVEAFAAAALKMQIAEIPDDVEVNLPESRKAGKKHSDRRNRSDQRGRFDQRGLSDRKDKTDRNDKIKRTDKTERKEKFAWKEKADRREKTEIKADFEKMLRKPEKKFDKKHEKAEKPGKRKDKFPRSNEKNVKDVRMNGQAYKRRKK